MRRPFNTNPDGFMAWDDEPLLDLRNVEDSIREQLFFVTAYAEYDASLNLAETPLLEVIDERDDAIAITTLPPVKWGVPVLDRYPVRGPVALRLSGVGSINGYIEEAGEDAPPRTLRPFSLDDATPSTLPVVIVHDDNQPGNQTAPITRVPEGISYLTLYAPRTDGGYLRYRPDAEDAASMQFQMLGTVQHAQEGLQCIFNRIPIRGPGLLTINASDTTVYGFFELD